MELLLLAALRLRLPVSILTRGKPRVEHCTVVGGRSRAVVSILTRGKPRVERACSSELPQAGTVSILTRGKPRVEPALEASLYRALVVSILTRGKPRVEPAGSNLQPGFGGGFNPHSRKTPSGTYARVSPRGFANEFQSSLEENPEWNLLSSRLISTAIWFQSSLEENPEWNPPARH